MEGHRIIVNNITTPIVVSRAPPDSGTKDDISTKAIITTILGASAGAAVAYAMSRGEEQQPRVSKPSRTVYGVVDAPLPHATEIVIRSPRASIESVQIPHATIHEGRSHDDCSGSRVRTIISKPHTRTNEHMTLPESSGFNAPTFSAETRGGSKVVKTSSHHCGSSHTGRVKTDGNIETIKPAASSIATKARRPRENPLPESRASILIDDGGDLDESKTIMPDDSISQVGHFGAIMLSRLVFPENFRHTSGLYVTTTTLVESLCHICT